MPNPDFDALITTTLKNYRAQLADNITNQAIFWQWMRDNKRFRTEPGGTSIVEPLLYGENSTVKSYSKYEPLDITPQEGITAAEYAWKQIAGSISISGFEEFVNQPSKTRILSLLEAKTTQLEISYREVLNRMIIQGDGTGNAGKDITGLALFLEPFGSESMVGGIDRSLPVNAWWKPQQLQWGFTAMSQANFGTGSDAAGLGKMRRAWNLAKRGTEKPDLILTDIDTFEIYETCLAVGERFAAPTRVLDPGGESLMFKQTPIAWDEDVTTGDMRFLNFMYLTMVTGKGKDFMPTPFRMPPDQEARVSQLIYYGQLTASNCKRQAVITLNEPD